MYPLICEVCKAPFKYNDATGHYFNNENKVVCLKCLAAPLPPEKERDSISRSLRETLPKKT